ncbi:MAG: tyrosine-type recombinase/integrase [Streptosporangiaceae bacterium]
MGRDSLSGDALVAAAADADPVTRLVLGWLAGKRSQNTRAAYACDIGITPPARACHAPSWLAWCERQGVHPVTGVTGMHVARYARELQSGGLSPASAARKLTAVSGWYAWLARRGHIAASPATDIARPRPTPCGRPTPGLTRDQALALVRAADHAPGPQQARTAALVAVLLFTGARVSEVIDADIGDLGTDQGRRVLQVTRHNGHRHSLPLPGPAATRLDAYLSSRGHRAAKGRTGARGTGAHSAGSAAHGGGSAAHGGGSRAHSAGSTPPGDGDARMPVFATASGGRLFAADVWRTVRRVARRAGLPADLTAHLGPDAMRHTFAMLYLDAGGSLRDLQVAMGHADPRTTRRYEQARQARGRGPGYLVAAYLGAEGTTRDGAGA